MFWNPPVLMIIGSNRLNYKSLIAPGQARLLNPSVSSGFVLVSPVLASSG